MLTGCVLGVDVVDPPNEAGINGGGIGGGRYPDLLTFEGSLEIGVTLEFCEGVGTFNEDAGDVVGLPVFGAGLAVE